MRTKKTTDEFRYFFKSNFSGVNILFVFIYSNEDHNSKRFKPKLCYLPKGIIDNYIVIISRTKNITNQLIHI